MVHETVQADRAAVAVLESVLQRVGQQFIDNEARRHRDVDRDWPGVDLEVQMDAFDRVRPHHRRGDLAEIHPQIDGLRQTFL